MNGLQLRPSSAVIDGKFTGGIAPVADSPTSARDLQCDVFACASWWQRQDAACKSRWMARTLHWWWPAPRRRRRRRTRDMLGIQRIDQRLLVDQPPRAQLTMRTPLFIFASALASMMFLVFSVSGVCSVMKSARLNRSSRSTFLDADIPARSGDRNGQMRLPSCAAQARGRRRSNRCCPTDPPRVLAVDLDPHETVLLPLAGLGGASACGISRASASIRVMACSAVVIEIAERRVHPDDALGRGGGVSPHCRRRSRRGRSPSSRVAFSMILAVALVGGADREAVVMPITSASLSLSCRDWAGIDSIPRP